MSDLDAVILNEVKKLAAASGGSSGVPINSSMALNVGAVDLYTGEGQAWLKTGVISPDVGSYPDAYSYNRGVADYAMGTTSIYRALTTDGVNIYAMEDATDFIRKLSPSLSLISSIPSGETADNKSMLCWLSGESCFLVGRYGIAAHKKVSTTGVVIGTLTFSETLTKLATNGVHFFGNNAGTPTVVKKFNLDGSYTGESLTTTQVDTVSASGNVLYVLYGSNIEMFDATTLAPIGRMPKFQGDSTYTRSISVSDLGIFLSSDTTIRKYALTVGDPIAKFEAIKLTASTTTNTEKGNPIYTRIL